MTHRRRLLTFLLALALGTGVAACGGDERRGGGAAAPAEHEMHPEISGDVTVTGVWRGAEQESFRAVLDGFTERYPNVTVSYTAGGDDLPAELADAVDRGDPPDVAVVGRRRLVEKLAASGALEPIEFARERIAQGFGQDWLHLGTVDGKLYGLVFKAENQSTVWFNPQVYGDAGVEPPEDWESFVEDARTIGESGTPAWSIAGADGWTLTDLFENLYLRIAGPEKYDQLTVHAIPWTDESVVRTLEEMRRITGDAQNIAGGVEGALQTGFHAAVAQVYADPPRAAQIVGGHTVADVIGAATDAAPGEGFDVFGFPDVEGGTENAVVGVGDTVVLFADTPASRSLVEYLASAEAAEIWAVRGGFATGNSQVDPQVYPDDITRRTASALAEAEVVRFDMSEQAPAGFGATPGRGEQKALQDFLRHGDVARAAAELEQAAARAYRD